MSLHGSFVALVTPFTAEEKVDEAALAALIEWHIEQGTQGIVPCGTTGESATFSHAEQELVIAKVCEIVNGRIPVIAGAGSNSTSEAVNLAKAAAGAGADAILTITPYYNKPNQEGQYRHFCAVGEAVDVPLVLYNVPSRTGVNMLPATAVRVSESVKVGAVKEASGLCEQTHELVQAGIPVLSGDDALTLPLMALGAAGVISVVSNFAPKVMAGLCDAMLAGDLATARQHQVAIHELADVAFCDTNPIPAKAAVAALGMCTETFRLPLVPIEDAMRERVLAAMRKHGILA